MRTIAAIATALINCPIHIIRVSGPDTFDIVNKIVSKPINIKPNTIQRNTIIDKNQIVDDVLLNIFVKPNSYTGENLIEINCHGNPIVTKKILNLLFVNGCEQANPGEFSMQALINNKMNYYQIEATNNLINASNEKAAKFAINSIIGSDVKKIEEIKNNLFQITGSVEVNIDYPEYDDVPQLNHQQIIKLLKPIKKELEIIYQDSIKVQPIFSGLKIAIVGKPNVGKSSLLNLLTNENRAIVSSKKGTTRDVIESSISFNGIHLKLLDTAGIRSKTKDTIEIKGIKKSIEAIKNADLVIWLTHKDDNNDKDFETKLKDKKYLKVFNKYDLYGKQDKAINISTKLKDIKELISALEKEIYKLDISNYNHLILQSDRQINLLNQVIIIIDSLLSKLNNNEPLDLLQTDFEKCIVLLNKIIGKQIEFDKLDELFKNFCLGK